MELKLSGGKYTLKHFQGWPEEEITITEPLDKQVQALLAAAANSATTLTGVVLEDAGDIATNNAIVGVVTIGIGSEDTGGIRDLELNLAKLFSEADAEQARFYIPTLEKILRRLKRVASAAERAS